MPAVKRLPVVVIAALLAGMISTVGATHEATARPPGIGFASVHERPVRGERTGQTVPHPSGRCDDLAPGLPDLRSDVRVRDVRVIGTSLEGRPIWAEYHGPASPSATIVVIGQIHGNECSPLLLIDRIRNHPPRSVGIWLIPTLNPDGHASYERRNAAGVDLNADGGRFSQPETVALRDFVASVRPPLTVHVHSPNGFVGAYPSGAPIATGLCWRLGDATSLRCSGAGAGFRSDRSRWFLWQGLRPLGGETLLIELLAVSDSEVPGARPRPATRSVEAVDRDVAAIVDALDAAFA